MNSIFINRVKKQIKQSKICFYLLKPIVDFVRESRKPSTQRQYEWFQRFLLSLSTVLSPPIFFVKVGANDGITGDPCSDIFITDKAWRGLLIEPVPYLFKRLKENYAESERFSIENVAIGPQTGLIPFYYVDSLAKERIPNIGEWFDQLGSFDRSHIIKNSDGLLTPYIIETQIEVHSLDAVLEKNGIKEIHLLHIDVEGYDYEVLKTLKLSKNLPLSIFIEYKHLSITHRKEMVHLLESSGYATKDCGGDYFALHSESFNQLKRLKSSRTNKGA